MKFPAPALRRGILTATCALLPLLGGAGSSAITIVDVDHLTWKDYPGLPGVTFTVVAGNPSQPGIYTIRARFAPNTMSAPHWHPEARYVTVLKGTWWAGTGAKFDRDTTTPLKAGGFAIHTPHEIHYDGAKDEECILEIVGMGPATSTPAESK